MSKPKFSAAEVEKIQAMVHEMKSKIDQTFLEPPDEVNIAEIKALRVSLEKMGFMVTVKYNMDAVQLRLDVDVTLWWPKEIN